MSLGLAGSTVAGAKAMVRNPSVIDRGYNEIAFERRPMRLAGISTSVTIKRGSTTSCT